jgi:predicted DNA-binding transcriptional regulator YafY
MKALERRQAIIELLCERRTEKIENLAFEFSVNECTIRRDIQELSLSYPIYTKTGTYGGVYVAEDYYLGKQYLRSEEKELLESLASSVGDDQRKMLESIIRRFGRPSSLK